jgi:hypothetical protein
VQNKKIRKDIQFLRMLVFFTVVEKLVKVLQVLFVEINVRFNNLPAIQCFLTYENRIF